MQDQELNSLNLRSKKKVTLKLNFMIPTEFAVTV